MCYLCECIVPAVKFDGGGCWWSGDVSHGLNSAHSYPWREILRLKEKSHFRELGALNCVAAYWGMPFLLSSITKGTTNRRTPVPKKEGYSSKSRAPHPWRVVILSRGGGVISYTYHRSRGQCIYQDNSIIISKEWEKEIKQFGQLLIMWREKGGQGG